MSEQHNEEVEQKVVTKGPGDLLQAARIEQGITVEDIARQMNLNARILQSIEDDDYTEIQSPIFIRGYLRTYSRLVGVDEDQVIKLFGVFYQVEDPDIKTIGNTAPQISSNDIRVKWMTYAVVLGLVVLISVWWVNNYRSSDVETAFTEPTMASNDSTAVQGDINIPLTITQTKIVAATPNETIDPTLKSESMSDNKEPEINEVKKDQVESIKVAIKSDIPNAVDVKVELVKNIESKKDESLNVQPTTPAENKPFIKELSATSGSDVLEINVISASWGEIKDASKFKLIQDLMDSGSRFRMVGQKPFKVFLGNGYGVEIKLNGKAIDFSSHIKSNNTARFEIDKS